MSDRSKYMFGAALAGVALSGTMGIVERAHAALVTNATFTFESTFGLVSTTSTNTAGSVASITAGTFGPLLADSGTGSAYGMHAATNTVYSVPAGNGSAHAFSSNNWAVGDSYQFSVPTTGIQGIVLSFDESGSATGPSHYTLTASADGVNFTAVSSYTVALSFTVTSTAAGGVATQTGFAGGTSFANFSQAFDLSSITSLNNNPLAAFRLTDADTVALNGTGTVGSGGTDRVDNFVLAGTAVTGTPEPASLSLLGLGALGLLTRRKRQA